MATLNTLFDKDKTISPSASEVSGSAPQGATLGGPIELRESEGLAAFALSGREGEEAQGTIMKETPRARMAMLLLAQGYTQTEVEAKLEAGKGWCCRLMKQPWFRDKLVVLMHHKAEPAIDDMLRAGASEAIMVNRELMHFGQSEAVRQSAASTMLKVALGDKLNLTALPTNLGDIESAIKRQEEELKALTDGKPA